MWIVEIEQKVVVEDRASIFQKNDATSMLATRNQNEMVAPA